MTAPGDVIINLARVSADIIHRKGRKNRRPLTLDYVINPAWAPGTGPHNLLQRWMDIHPASPRDVQLEGRASARGRISRHSGVTSAINYGPAPRADFYYASHSPHIGGLNELVDIQYSWPWIIHRIDWRSDAMFSMYFDSRILLNDD